MNKETWKCACDPPDEEEKEAHFEIDNGVKLCRHICKKSGPIVYTEVYGKMKSDCIARGKERMVKKSIFLDKPCVDDGCPADDRGPQCKYDCSPNPAACTEKENERGFFCLLEEYAHYLER